MKGKKIEYYVTENLRAPVLEWVSCLEVEKQIIVDRFIQRAAQGGARKAIKNLKNGVYEIKIPYASGLFKGLLWRGKKYDNSSCWRR